MRKHSFAMAAAAALLCLTSALPAFAASSASGDKKMTKPKMDTACVQTAVAAREAAIGTAWSAFASAVTAAYTARASSLNAAWGMTDGKARSAAVKAAWDTFGKARKGAGTQWNTSNKAAWAAAKTAVAACKGAPPEAGAETSNTADTKQ